MIKTRLNQAACDYAEIHTSSQLLKSEIEDIFVDGAIWYMNYLFYNQHQNKYLYGLSK